MNLITKKLRIYAAEKFLKGLSDPRDSNNLYLFLGKSEPWIDEENPIVPTETKDDETYAFFRMFHLKKVDPANCTLACPKYDWTTGTIYSEYSDSVVLDDLPTPYYVITDERNVYKCLDNNSGAASTVKPTGQSTNVLITADGYHWKFMLTVSADDAAKFMTGDYIPIKRLVEDDGSKQYEVQVAANGGHGSNAASELGAKYLLIQVSLGIDEEKFTTTNDFRQHGLLFNPKLWGVSTLGSGATYTQSWDLTLEALPAGSFTLDEILEGVTSGATGQVLDYDTVTKIVRLVNVTGTFVSGENIQTSENVSYTVTDVKTPDLSNNSGDILAILNHTPITKNPSQVENFELVIQF